MPPTSPPPRTPLGSRVIRLEVVTSTSDVAKQMLRAGEPHGTMVVAAQQLRGRGQRGRRWVSPRGGLWVSLLVRPIALEATAAGLLNLAAAVGAAEAAAAVSGVAVSVKWPNDLLIERARRGRPGARREYRKVGGVLVETAAAGANLAWAVIGVGVNANVAIADLLPAVGETAASLHLAAGREIPLDALLTELCARTDDLLRLLEGAGREEILRRWRALDTTPGRSVRAASDPTWRGRALGVDNRGRLIIRRGRQTMVFASTRGLVIE